jgi:hypothetical protein
VIGVDRIEAWRGQKVIDQADEDLGKLEDVYFDSGTGTPLLISVKSGLLGRKSSLIPLAGATVGPDYVRVAHSKEVVSRAGESRGHTAPGDEELAALGSAYGLRFSERVHLRSATEIEQTRAEAEAARARADRLEAEAQRKSAAHDAAREQVRSAGETVGQAESEAEEARRAALEARRDAERYDPS